jgi:PAS domain S-box-containing protein
MTLQRYLTRLIWVCTLPLLLLAAWFGFERLRDDREAVRHEASHLLAAAQSLIDQSVRARLAGLQALAASPLADDPAHAADFHREAQGYRAAFGSHVALVDAQRGTRLHTAVPPGSPAPPAPRPAGRSAIHEAFERGVPAVGDRFQGTLANDPLIGLAAPGLRDGRVAFVVGTIVPLRQIESLLTGLPPVPGFGVTLFDSQGTPLARLASADEPVSAEGDLVVTAPLQAAPWLVEVRVPRAVAVRAQYRTAGGLVVLLIGATLAAFIGGRMASARLARSVRSLSESPDRRAPTLDIAEIGQARALIDDAFAQRNRAEAERRQSEQLYRERLERGAADLQMREAQLRGILDSASDAIIATDAAQRIVMANPAAARVFGQAGQALVGMPLAALFPAELADAQLQAIESARGGRHLDLVGLRADTSRFPIEAAVARAGSGGDALTTVVLRDVSERRRAEDALRASKARLEATLESMSDALFITDPDGRFVEVNTAFAKMHRFGSRAECATRIADYPMLFDAFWPDGKPAPPEQWSVPRALRGESASDVEYLVRRRDTGQSWVGSYSFAPIRDPDGTIAGSVVTGRDVTEARRLQAELRTSQAELRSLMAEHHRVEDNERRRIARELHDELQQVLVAIKMETAAIERELATDARRLQPIVARIEQLAGTGITSTRRIVNDLRPLILEELGLAPALQVLCREFSKRTGIDAQVAAADLPTAHPALPERVEICLYRVAQESLTNVAKHAGAHRVRVEIEACDGDGDGELTMRVVDDGRGLHRDGRRSTLSFGLKGMSERVAALGGTLHVDNGATGGAAVTVTIPLPAADATLADAPAA